MHDISRAGSTATTTLTITGNLHEDEYREAVRAAGVFRSWHSSVIATATALAATGTALFALGASPYTFAALLSAAVAYAALGLRVPPARAARSFRREQAQGTHRCTVDDTGVTTARGGVELLRVPWSSFARHHETDRLFVLVGRAGRQRLVLALPKRLLSAPGEAELLGALLEAHTGRHLR
ncbi:YcxB family protein [Streptomyces sp. NPDC046876]|uniref:YcxB family protein n=1 Tax=Streptomyces sp. NPDC046876 TaxID=3155616 RepID=UPI0034021F92